MSSEESNKRTRRVMLDIETVGLEIGAAIVEIGAVQFAPGGQIGETFHRSVSLTSSEVWANSPSFDCEQLEHAGEAVGVSMPWEFYQERDVRTLDALPHSVDLDQQGTEHTALDDALYQARVAGAILAELGGSTEVAP